MVDQARILPRYRPMPVLWIEDDHFDFDRPRNNFTVALSRFVSWGYFNPGPSVGVVQPPATTPKDSRTSSRTGQ